MVEMETGTFGTSACPLTESASRVLITVQSSAATSGSSLLLLGKRFATGARNSVIRSVSLG